jgi:hypothetical protein
MVTKKVVPKKLAPRKTTSITARRNTGGKVAYSTWKKCYGKWKAECREEIKEHGWEPKDVEFFEDGSIRFKGDFHSSTGTPYVTPWRKSKHYRE